MRSIYVTDEEGEECMRAVLDKKTKQAFKDEFVYHARIKFGLSDGISAFERALRRVILPAYLIVFYFTYHHSEALYNLLFLCGCTYMNNMAMAGSRGFYHRRRELDEKHSGFRAVEDFTFLQKFFTYLVAASVLTSIFVTGMFAITGSFSVNYMSVGLAIAIPLLYNLVWADSSSKR